MPVPSAAVPENLSLTLERPQHLPPGSSKITRVWLAPAPAEEPVAGSGRWHLEHPPDKPDAGFAAAGEALRAQPK